MDFMPHNTQAVFKAIEQTSPAELEAILADDPGLVHARHANPDLFHWTTLQFAAARGKLEACRLLVEKGAEVYTNPMSTYPLVLQADDVEWSNFEDNPLSGTFHGPDGVIQFMGNLSQLRLTTFALESLMSEGDRVIGVLDITYTVKSTGKSQSGMAVHVMDFKDGKMTRFREIAASAAQAWT